MIMYNSCSFDIFSVNETDLTNGTTLSHTWRPRKNSEKYLHSRQERAFADIAECEVVEIEVIVDDTVVDL